ncbi:MAG TPA: hypothetical protein VGO62_08495 [Myxococcota bacterium]|jgi:hypothetical protein
MSAALRRTVLAKGYASEGELAALEAWPAYGEARLAERLFRSGLLSDQQLVDAFTALGATDGTSELVHGQPAPAALGAISRLLAQKHRALPLRVERSRLIVAMLDPADDDGLEKLAWFCGLAVEPRAVRPRILFQALSEAYGVMPVRPDSVFLAHNRGHRDDFVEPPHSGADSVVDGEVLPAPSADIPHRVFGTPEATADPYESPLARSVIAVCREVIDWNRERRVGEDVDEDAHERGTSLSLERLSERERGDAPIDQSALAAIARSLPAPSALAARDQIPPRILDVLVPPLRSAVLFLARGSVAVGWDGKAQSSLTGVSSRGAIRDVLLPLTAPSAFARAFQWQRIAVGNAADPTTTERILWRHLKQEAPSSFAVLPMLSSTAGVPPGALLYVDRAHGMIDDDLVTAIQSALDTLAHAVSPFVVSGTLFPEVRDLPDKLRLRLGP